MTVKPQTKQDEQGLVSIVITMVITLILGLIVLGFTQQSNREQRQALDRQLSTQAFYAAESGIDMAANYIRTNGATNFEDCSSFSGGPIGVGQTMETAQVSCLMVDAEPKLLQYDNIGTSASEVIPLEAATGTIKSINFSWQDIGNGTDFSCSTSGLPSSLGCSPGMLRVDVVPASAINDRITANSTVRTVFIRPRANASPAPDYTLTNNGAIISGYCNQVVDPNTFPYFCKASINVGDAEKYYLRIKSIYTDNRLSITATNSSGNVVELVGAQVLIDSTGKAVDVLRRVQARVNISPFVGGGAEFPIHSLGSLCKRFTIEGSGGAVVSQPTPPDDACGI